MSMCENWSIFNDQLPDVQCLGLNTLDSADPVKNSISAKVTGRDDKNWTVKSRKIMNPSVSPYFL